MSYRDVDSIPGDLMETTKKATASCRIAYIRQDFSLLVSRVAEAEAACRSLKMSPIRNPAHALCILCCIKSVRTDWLLSHCAANLSEKARSTCKVDGTTPDGESPEEWKSYLMAILISSVASGKFFHGLLIAASLCR